VLALQRILLSLAVFLPIITCVRLSIDIYSQSQAMLDGPLANSFSKAHAVREVATAFCISAITFFIILKVSFPPKFTKTLWVSNYLLMSGVLLALSIISFFLIPHLENGFGREFYFASWFITLNTIHYVARDLTFALLILFIAVRIRKIS